MVLSDFVKKIRGNALQALVLDDKVLGYRIKVFDLESQKYMYYDVSSSVLKDMQGYLNSHTLPKAGLIRHNGGLYTQEELDNSIAITELKAGSMTDKIVNLLKLSLEGVR